MVLVYFKTILLFKIKIMFEFNDCFSPLISPVTINTLDVHWSLKLESNMTSPFTANQLVRYCFKLNINSLSFQVNQLSHVWTQDSFEKHFSIFSSDLSS